MVLSAIGYLTAGAVRLKGRVQLGDTVIDFLTPSQRRDLWATRIKYIAQDARAALNPAYRIGTQIREVLQVNCRLGRAEAQAKACELLRTVKLTDAEHMLRRYPHQCSGGQLQRVAIALAIASDPDVLILDEPTTGLDVTTQAEVVAMLVELIRKRNAAAIYISHDLALLGKITDEIMILYAGEIVERGPTRAVLGLPRHPYTRALLDALPSAAKPVRPVGLTGLPPGRVVTDSCAFASRCRWAVDRCRTLHPELQLAPFGKGLVRCARAAELGPLVESTQPHVGAVTRRPTPTPVLSIRSLTCGYGRKSRRLKVVSKVSLEVAAGEVVALVGESGSGKSTIGRAIVGLVPADVGEICLDSILLDRAGRRTQAQRNAIQIIFQDPDLSLNPRHSVEELVARSLVLYRPDIDKRSRREAVLGALSEVQLDPTLASRYPHQLSGGQKQRVAIARAFVVRPQLVVCDEIVSGQDVSVQATILELIRAMQQRHGTSLLFISHDLAVIRCIAQRVYVIQRGRIVETGPTEQIFEHPQMAYSRKLLGSVMEAS